MGTACGTNSITTVATAAVLAEEVQFHVSGHPAIANRGGPSGRKDGHRCPSPSCGPTDSKGFVETVWKTDGKVPFVNSLPETLGCFDGICTSFAVCRTFIFPTSKHSKARTARTPPKAILATPSPGACPWAIARYLASQFSSSNRAFGGRLHTAKMTDCSQSVPKFGEALLNCPRSLAHLGSSHLDPLSRRPHHDTMTTVMVAVMLTWAATMATTN